MKIIMARGGEAGWGNNQCPLLVRRGKEEDTS